ALFAAARRVARFALERTVAEIDFHTHLMPVRGAECGDGGIVHDLYFTRQVDSRRVVDAIGSELIDKCIAGQDQGGGAERQIQLRGGEAVGPVRPAGMIERDLRCMYDDARYIGRTERMPFADVGERIKRRMVAADASVKFKRYPHGLVTLAQSIGQRVEIETV